MVISDAILDQSGHILETQHVNLRRGDVSLSGSRSRSMSDDLVTEASDGKVVRQLGKWSLTSCHKKYVVSLHLTVCLYSPSVSLIVDGHYFSEWLAKPPKGRSSAETDSPTYPHTTRERSPKKRYIPPSALPLL